MLGAYLPRRNLRLLHFALLATAACSDTEHRLGGAFPDAQDRGGTGGFGPTEPGTASAGAGGSAIAMAGKSATIGAGGPTVEGPPSGGRGENGTEPNGGSAAGDSNGTSGANGTAGTAGGTAGTAEGSGGALAGVGGNIGSSAGAVGMSGGGAFAGSGGAFAGSGGAFAGSGGALAGSGGAFAGSGGTVAGSGGTLAGSGGSIGSSGGAAGMSASAGSAGIPGGGSGGASGSCVGSCSLLSVDACSGIPQCAPTGICTNGMTELPCANLSENSCVQKPWCLWMGALVGCKLQPNICQSLYQDEASCSSTTDDFYCVWKPACGGPLNCALLKNQAQCSTTPGCGWSTGEPGKLSLSQTQLAFALNCPSPPVFASKTITLTNTGGTTLTWSRTAPVGDFTVVSPSSGTLIPNAQVTVSITPAFSSFSGSGPTPGHDYNAAPVTFTTNVSGDVTHSVGINESSNGYVVSPPASIDFGTVVVGTSVTKIISGASNQPGAALGSSNPDFVLNGVAPLSNGTWSLTFTPSAAGPASTTLTMGSFSGCVFPPKTFTAYGNY